MENISVEQAKPTATYPAIVGSLLAAARQQKGVDQGSLATQIGLSQPTLSRIERGDSALTIEQLYRAAHALGRQPSEILAAADSATSSLASSGYDVKDMKVSEAVKQGLAVVGFATLILLAAKLLSK